MKKLLLAVTALFTLVSFSSCTKDDNTEDTKDIVTIEVSIDASTVKTENPANPARPISTSYWNYYSFSQNEVLGKGLVNAEDNAKWAARTDWDIAISTYKIKTNGGTTSTGKASVFVAEEDLSYGSILAVPANAKFEADVNVTSPSMGGGTTTESKSISQVVIFKKDAAGKTMMPPVYLKSPVYIFKTADGSKNYKVNFTQYQNADKVTGHVMFDCAEL